MKIINTPKELSAYAKAQKDAGKSIGLVPTMGYLHDGHASLIKKSASENDVTIVSVFVNPTQFGAGEDLDSYPRDIEHDCTAAEAAGANVVFHPEPGDMYPAGYGTYVSVDSDMTKVLCGRSRPTHFRGVTTVVAKLFNISAADRAYFGQKDAQQLAVIMRMVSDLNMGIEIIPCPIVREPDGLAMSSRNTYLSPGERTQAPVLSRSLSAAKKLIDAGERDVKTLRDEISRIISCAPDADAEYIEFRSFPSLDECGGRISGKVLIALAVRFGKTRLIDNIIVNI
ncbi:MAG TPA: pantoate--beta-alanine ligase [Candidatus Monoglobus merdigallinarum]|uniref:Pantothenate synthetase n=1 Tax=Candidatus Monoglobus merdigallinarum TaxID=2838698 RepID=A0A9D1TMI8_9FIRM|nr:pantoate--beta-alanine ligase [Candidatus Monoglobus merdigallinarum]